MKAADCILGIDAGSSVVKAVAFDCAGSEVCAYEIPADLSRPHPLWVEQEMNQMWEMVKTCTVKVSQALRRKKGKIGGIGITSTGDGTWMMDGKGNPVRPGMLWCDGRAGDIVARLHRQGLAEEAFAICGTSVFTGSQAVQLAWLREHEPAALKKAAVIFHAKDWLFHQFTGEITSDDTDESLTMLRMSTRQYDRELFRIFKIDDLWAKFPPVRPCGENVGTIRSAIAEELGLPAGLLVGSGPMDVAACALGTGAIERGQASSILGTAGIHQLIMDKPILKPKMVGMTLCHGVRDRKSTRLNSSH
jgi:sugar (pentulose or hexulose) kinase